MLCVCVLVLFCVVFLIWVSGSALSRWVLGGFGFLLLDDGFWLVVVVLVFSLNYRCGRWFWCVGWCLIWCD